MTDAERYQLIAESIAKLTRVKQSLELGATVHYQENTARETLVFADGSKEIA